MLVLRTTGQNVARGAPVMSPATPAAGKTYAIIIGISQYKNVRPLQYADKDAEAFAHFLQSPSGGNLPPDNIELFTNEKATRENVGDAISGFVRKAQPGDRIYFFFAGHGDMEDLTQIENGLLLLYNSPNGNYFGMNDDVLEVLDLKRYLSPLSERGIEVYFIVDACHSGNLKGGVQGMQQTASALAASWGHEFKILSCQPNQLSLESKEWGGGRGLFSLELEEGLFGMADRNGDGKVTLLELQQYLTEKVASISEGTQIPVVLGDLSKPVATVNPTALAALKKRLAEDYPMLAVANTKGGSELTDSLDPIRARLYQSFVADIEKKDLISPAGHNALAAYRSVQRLDPEHPLVKMMRRNLATALNERFNAIVTPLLQGKTSTSSREECGLAATELDSCLNILGRQHYMYDNIKARMLYVKAMALTWALYEWDYQVALRPTVEESTAMLEESERLEPNAAYTLSSLGTNYFLLYEYDKANAKFQKYLDLRPNDLYAKFSLAKIYTKLKRLSLAEALLKQIIREDSTKFDPAYEELTRVYTEEGKPHDALLLALNLVKSDSTEGNFLLGTYYSKLGAIDSAKYYYGRNKGKCTVCDNNIGYTYMINYHFDSAAHYFKKISEGDFDYEFRMYNLGTIDLMTAHYDTAISEFIESINHTTPFVEAYFSRPDIYFRKKYSIRDTAAFLEFKKSVLQFSIQYESYVGIVYCYLRDSQLILKSSAIDYWFSRLKRYKEYDDWTYYHYACYKAILNDKAAALDALKKSLAAGFGNYFLLTSDDDLASIRDTPEFIRLLKESFADRITFPKE